MIPRRPSSPVRFDPGHNGPFPKPDTFLSPLHHRSSSLSVCVLFSSTMERSVKVSPVHSISLSLLLCMLYSRSRLDREGITWLDMQARRILGNTPRALSSQLEKLVVGQLTVDNAHPSPATVRVKCLRVLFRR